MELIQTINCGDDFSLLDFQLTEIMDCPICKRLVCDHCFLICDDLDMCVQCAEKLNEKGTVVG